MAEDIGQPHDSMVRVVLRDITSATRFLQDHLPQEVSRALNWPTLKLLEGTFIDEDLRRSQSDFLYEVEHVSGEQSIRIYTLLEHQSTPDRWMPFRLLKYCCRIWDVNLAEKPTPSALRPIVPLVFYQGERSWSYSTDFAELFIESVRDWPWVPQFCHELIDQSGMQPEELQGELKVRLMQVLLLAAYHPERPWMELVVELLDTMLGRPPSGGTNEVRVFLHYILQTQGREAIALFQEALQRRAPEVGGDLMTYAQELLEKGRLEERVKMIENLLRLDAQWTMIEEVTGVNETQFKELKQRLRDMDA